MPVTRDDIRRIRRERNRHGSEIRDRRERDRESGRSGIQQRQGAFDVHAIDFDLSLLQVNRRVHVHKSGLVHFTAGEEAQETREEQEYTQVFHNGDKGSKNARY